MTLDDLSGNLKREGSLESGVFKAGSRSGVVHLAGDARKYVPVALSLAIHGSNQK